MNEENTSGFYTTQFGELTFAPNAVYAPTYELHRELKDIYQLPVYDWYWFESEAEARAFYQL